MNPFHLLNLYCKTLRENHYSESLPWNERIYHFVLPVLLSTFVTFTLLKDGLSDSTVNLLLTVHGILISVLMASFTPFIEKLDKERTPKQKLTEEESEFYASVKIAKKLIFSANSLSIFISLIIVGLLLIAKFVDKIKGYTFKFDEYQFDLTPIFYLFNLLLFSLIILNVVLIVRTVHILSDIVIAKIDETE